MGSNPTCSAMINTGETFMIYFTSDLHLGHENIIRYCNRPFKDAIEMNHAIIDNWNDTVSDNDEVYILGDLCMSGVKIVESYLHRMKGIKYLIRGNHDYFVDKYKGDDFVWIKDYHELRYNKNLLVLCHYPFLEWNGYNRGSIHLHGHQHNHHDYNVNQVDARINRYDVGVDANNFTPVSIDKIIKFFNK